ncbi:hypothetical protein K2173_013991 [Erythroxylum novogranatense]|uniref:EF-hand domain-containing protein n=1 Tax=Erythroxylum novogranatense TaxID=1862640 RepID=A0AAV8SDG8_9ROSI|nr:hypothetical protein K2173_013991 [Erythroxylum novogranatense]
MVSIYFYCLITLQKALVNTYQSYTLLHVLLYIILCKVILNQVNRIQNLKSKVWFFLQSQARNGSTLKAWAEKNNKIPDSSSKKSSSPNMECYSSVCRKDMKMVMESLGIFCSPESEELKEMTGSSELLELFDEKEPSVEEIKDTFEIFDENQKGFIVAEDLQRVLSKLGLKEGIELVNCRSMISRFDENGHGSIDFNQFVEFMENSFR